MFLKVIYNVLKQAIDILNSTYYKLLFDVLVDPLAHFRIKELASYIVALVMAIYSTWWKLT